MGFKFFLDAFGGAYTWHKGKLKLQHPQKCCNPQTLSHNHPDGGYLLLNIVGAQGIRGRILVHRGVALAFPEICGVPTLLQNQVDHINWDKYDNRARNLRWVSASENGKNHKPKNQN